MNFSRHFLRASAPLLTAFLLTLCLPGAGELRAATATDPVGYTVVNCPGSSDTIASLPLARPAVFRATGAVSTAASRGATSGKTARAAATSDATGATTISFSGSPFSVSQFKYIKGEQPNTYFAQLNGGAKEGSFYTITDNDASSLTLDLNGDDLSAVTGAVNVSIVPYWTLATLFPSGQGVASSTATTPGTRILVPDTKGTGTDLGATGAYFYSSGAASWYDAAAVNRPGSRKPVFNDLVLYPDNFFTVRNTSADATTLAVCGAVITTKLSIPLATNSAGQQDNSVALARPVPVTLNDSGLISSGAFAASSSAGTGDQLLVFDNAAVALNKPPSAVYTFADGVWQKSGGSGDAGGDAVFSPGAGVIIRKAATPGGSTVLWLNSPTY